MRTSTKDKKATEPVEPCCANCKHASLRMGSNFVHCGINLPPMMKISEDMKRQLVNKNYRCDFHAYK